MRLLAVVVLVLAVVAAAGQAAVDPQGDAVDSASREQEVKRMRVKALRAILAKRGVSCTGCAEKQDYVARVLETEGLDQVHESGPTAADFARPKQANPAGASFSPHEVDPGMADRILKEMEAKRAREQEMMEKLRAQGFRFQNRDDDIMDMLRKAREQRGGAKPRARKSRPGQKPRGEPARPAVFDEADVHEAIELD